MTSEMFALHEARIREGSDALNRAIYAAKKDGIEVHLRQHDSNGHQPQGTFTAYVSYTSRISDDETVSSPNDSLSRGES
jgi:hypothetical protein